MDAAIVDGAAHLATMIHGMLAAGAWQDRRGSNLLDGGCPFYGTYATSDGEAMAVGPLEQRFYDEFSALLGLPDTVPDRADLARWEELRTAVADRFRTRTRAEWTEVFASTDACVAPVLSLREAPSAPAPRGPRHLRGARRDHPARPRPALLGHPHRRTHRPRPARYRRSVGGRGVGRAGPARRAAGGVAG